MAATRGSSGAGKALSQDIEPIELSLAVEGNDDNTVTFKLGFKNVSSGPVRVFFLPQPFRPPTQWGLSARFHFGGEHYKEKDGFPPLEIPRPHGIKVTEDHFHLIEAGETYEDSHTVKFPDAYGAEAVWTYTNHLDRWEGGKMTLDGETESLFGGERIPDIFVGTLKSPPVRFRLLSD